MASLPLARTAPRFAFILAAALAAAACGPKNQVTEAKGPHAMSQEDIDKDPLVLLPSGALAVVAVDARAAFDDKTLGPPLGDLVKKLMPVGEEAGLVASRDVDRVTVASYALTGFDVAVVLSGRFDPEKLALAAKNHSTTATGGAIVESKYAEHTLYTVGNAGVTVLSKATVLAGTEGAIRRGLDRMKDGKLARDQQPWVYETVEAVGQGSQNKGAVFGLAVDMSTQNLASLAVGGLSIPFAEGLKTARALGTLDAGKVAVSGTAAWNDEAHAQAGAKGLSQMGNMATAFAATGVIPRIDGLKIEPKGAEVAVSFSVDKKALADLLVRVPQFM